MGVRDSAMKATGTALQKARLVHVCSHVTTVKRFTFPRRASWLCTTSHPCVRIDWYVVLGHIPVGSCTWPATFAASLHRSIVHNPSCALRPVPVLLTVHVREVQSEVLASVSSHGQCLDGSDLRRILFAAAGRTGSIGPGVRRPIMTELILCAKTWTIM